MVPTISMLKLVMASSSPSLVTLMVTSRESSPSPTQSLNLSWNRLGLLLHKKKNHLRKSMLHVPAMVPPPDARENQDMHPQPTPMQLPAALTLMNQLNKSPSSDMI